MKVSEKIKDRVARRSAELKRTYGEKVEAPVILTSVTEEDYKHPLQTVFDREAVQVVRVKYWTPTLKK